MKELTCKPEIEIVRFETVDIITTSGGRENELPGVNIG